MSPESFCYWLQGYLELTAAGDVDVEMTDEQVRCIKDHLALVFRKETPDRSKKKVKKKKSALEEAARLDLPVREPVTHVGPPVHYPELDMLCTKIDEHLKKRQTEAPTRVTCDTRKPIGGVSWTGGGFGQRYC